MSENIVELRVTSRERDLIVLALEEERTKLYSQGLSTIACDALLQKILPIPPDDVTQAFD